MCCRYPILLKSTSNSGCQVMVKGKVRRNFSAGIYQKHFDALLEHVLAAHFRLQSQSEFIVIKGAGNNAEPKLQSWGLVNFSLVDGLGSSALAGIAVVSQPLSPNITDFRLLRGIGRITSPKNRQHCRSIIPGTKGSMTHLQWRPDSRLNQRTTRHAPK